MSDTAGHRSAPDGPTPAQRRLRARQAAHASWARTADRAARTAPGTEGLLRRFERQVDPHDELPPDVRRTMAVHARAAHMLALAARSAKARRRARPSTALGDTAAGSDTASDDRRNPPVRRTRHPRS
jgi:hypothetical protein